MSETITQSRTITAKSGAEYRLEYILEPDAENPYENGDWMLTALVVAGDRNTIDVAHMGQSGTTNAERIAFERVQQYVTRFTRNYEYPRSERAATQGGDFAQLRARRGALSQIGRDAGHHVGAHPQQRRLFDHDRRPRSPRLAW